MSVRGPWLNRSSAGNVASMYGNFPASGLRICDLDRVPHPDPPQCPGREMKGSAMGSAAAGRLLACLFLLAVALVLLERIDVRQLAQHERMRIDGVALVGLDRQAALSVR